MESQIVSSLLLLVHVAMATSASSQQENVHPIPYVDSAWDSEPSPPTSANGTAFRANLTELLGSFPSAAAPSGFAAMSRGAAGRDRVFVRCLCVDGGSPDDYFACLNAGAAESLGQLRHSPARRLLFRRVPPGLRRHQRLRVERGGPPRGDLSRRHRLVSDYGPAAPAPPTLEVPPTLGGEKETSSDAVPVREVALVLPLAALLLVMVIVLIAVLIRIMRRTTRSRNAPSEAGNREGQECYVVPAHLTLQVLRAATSNFSEGNKLGLGEGPFGQVFKGKLRDGQEIVVKRLFIAYTGLHEIQMEILSDALPNHSNLLQMLGYCLQEREALVLYEYMPNGSLDDLLSDPNRWRQLDWNARYAIIRGIAEGLVYLHGRPTGQRIILRNLMPRNVLLDRDMNPKISDTAVSPRDAAVVFPRYYCLHKPTEYIMTGVLTAKGNMFSFGVMVLEMVTGRRRVHSRPNDANSVPELLAYVREKWRTGSVADAVDAALGDGYPRNEVLNCVQIGLMCVEERPQSRPDASQVAVMLN